MATSTDKTRITTPQHHLLPHSITQSNNNNTNNAPLLISNPTTFLGTQRALESRNKIREMVSEMIASNGCPPELDLTLGDPTKFGPPFTPPLVLKNALIHAITSDESNGYAPAVGMDYARAAIASTRQGASFGDVLIAGGCSSALDIVLRSLAGPGDTVLVPCPGFPLYESLLNVHGITFARYRLDPDNDFAVDLKHLASLRALPRIRAIFVNNPANPSGTTFSLSHLHDICRTIKDNFCSNAVVVADEIYENVVFSPQHEFYALSSITKQHGVACVTVSGLSKGWCCPGWRIGWSIAHPTESNSLADFLKASRQLAALSMGASTILQAVLPAVLCPVTDDAKAQIAEFRSSTNSCLQHCAQVFYDKLSHVRGIKPIRPTGAMYLYFHVDLATFGVQSTLGFCMKLFKEQKVMLLPGECFGTPGYIRVSIAAPERALLKCAEAIGKMAMNGQVAAL